MIYFFYGDDIEKRDEARDLIARLPAGEEGPFDSQLEMNDVSWDKEKFENLAKSNSLFESKQFLILENILENIEIKEFIMEHLGALKNSENIFVFIEKKAPKDTVNKFSKLAEEVKEFAFPKGKDNKADVFAITYPLERRDKKNMWLEFQKLQNTDSSPEAISGILFWKIKDMMLKNNYKNWTEIELKNLSSKLVSLHHDAHRGLIDFRIGIEKFILESL